MAAPPLSIAKRAQAVYTNRGAAAHSWSLGRCSIAYHISARRHSPTQRCTRRQCEQAPEEVAKELAMVVEGVAVAATVAMEVDLAAGPVRVARSAAEMVTARLVTVVAR